MLPRTSLAASALLLPLLLAHATKTHAAVFSVSAFGFGNATWESVVTNTVTVLYESILVISSVVFVIGAFMFTISAGDEGRKGTGKSLMIGALIGAAVTLGAGAIFNTVLFWLG